MNSDQLRISQNTDGSSNNQFTSGCMYRIMQSTTLDGKNLLKLIPLVNNAIHFFSAVPLPISTSSTSTKVSMIPLATTSCSAPTTCLPFFQNSKTGSILVTSVESPVTNNKVPPANSTHEKVFAASPALQIPNPTTVTLSGLPIRITQPIATSATDKGFCSLKTATLNSPALLNTQLSSLAEQNICKAALPALAEQKTQPSPTSTPDQMSCKVATVALHGSAVQRTEASPTLPKGMQTQNLTTGTMPGASVQRSRASPTSTADQKTYVLLKSSVLPSGHYLQIPANAEVKSVPASLLPVPIQQKILTTVASSLANWNKSAKAIPNVIYVCPVNTVKSVLKHVPNICPKNSVEVPTALLSDNSSGPSLASPANSVAVSNVNQSKFQDNPLKSAMKNKKQFPSRCLIPVKSSNDLASKILKNLADQQRVKEGLINLLPQPSPVLPTETEADLFSPSKENALVMFNSKVYLVIQKNSGSSGPSPGMVSTSESQTEKGDTSSIDLPQTNLQIKIKEEPKDPDFEPVKQKANQLECWPRERCNVPSSSNQQGCQGTSIKHEHMEPFCWRAGEEADEQLLKKAGIRTKLRICLTRISPKQLEQWENNSPAISESLKAPTHLTKKNDDVPTDTVLEETQVNVMLPVVKEEPIDPDYYTCQIKDVEIKVEPKSPVKRQAESINCSMAVKKQCLKSVTSNWEAEHAYTCLPVCNTEAPTLSTDEVSHFDSHSEQGALASTTEPSSMPEKGLIVKCSPFVTFSSVTGDAHDLFSGPSNVPAPSISSLSIEQSSATGSSTTHTSPLPLSVDETTRDEKIRRLKEILKEKEAALEAMRKKMIKAKSPAKRKSEKHRDKRLALNRELKRVCSCLPGEHPDGAACVNPCRRQGMFTSSMHAISGQDVTESSHMVTRSAAVNKVLDISAVFEGHFPKILHSSSVGKTTRDEKIRRLKEILKEKEAALETIRRNKVSAPLQGPPV